MMINVGALIGGVAVPLTAQKDVRKAYFLPVISLTTAIVLFVAGTARYVRSIPSSPIIDFLTGKKKKTVPAYAISNTGDRVSLLTIVKVSLLVVPFNM
jgi:POT family proton-dependent oligopeptide transporter